MAPLLGKGKATLGSLYGSTGVILLQVIMFVHLVKFNPQNFGLKSQAHIRKAGLISQQCKSASQLIKVA
jgi:hypothetical protein